MDEIFFVMKYQEMYTHRNYVYWKPQNVGCIFDIYSHKNWLTSGCWWKFPSQWLHRVPFSFSPSFEEEKQNQDWTHFSRRRLFGENWASQNHIWADSPVLLQAAMALFWGFINNENWHFSFPQRQCCCCEFRVYITALGLFCRTTHKFIYFAVSGECTAINFVSPYIFLMITLCRHDTSKAKLTLTAARSASAFVFLSDLHPIWIRNYIRAALWWTEMNSKCHKGGC